MYFIHYFPVLFMIFVSISLANHIIFEQVGEMASSVTYIHVKMQVGFQDWEEHYLSYIDCLDKIKKSATYNDEFGKGAAHPYWQVREMKLDLVKAHLQTIRNLTDNRQKSAQKLFQTFDNLRKTMPRSDQPNYLANRITRDTPRTQNQNTDYTASIFKSTAAKIISSTGAKSIKTMIRQPRGAISLGLGVLGTFMGLYNTFQIKALQRDLEQTQDAHNRLVEVVQTNELHLNQLNQTVEQLIKTLLFTKAYDISTIAAELMDIEISLKERLNQITHTVQKAQDHRLALDFLPADQLFNLFDKLEEQAIAIDHKLLTTQPSDCFQLELSYFFDGQNMQMLLHVPAVPKNSLLRLFKLHPFPLPIDKNYSMIPMVTDELLAISAGFSRASAHLSSTDLLGCHAVNNVYLCERHGILQKQLNSSCLGALYLQDFTTVQELCPLFIKPAAEMVTQLLQNWFLIFSPKAQTAYISCRNGTQGDAYLKSGITRIHLSPGCQMNLQFHLLNSDFAINLPSDIVHFQWDWDTLTLFPDASSEIAELLETGNDSPTLQDLNELKIMRPKRLWSGFKIFVTFICSTLALILIAIIILYLALNNPVIQRKIFDCLCKRKHPPLIEPLNQESPIQMRLYPTTSANAPTL